MSNKSPEVSHKEALNALAEFKALATDVLKAHAEEKSTYTERMKKMEDAHNAAMQKVMEMDASIKDFHKSIAEKVDSIEKKYADIYVDKSEDEGEEEEGETETPEAAETAAPANNVEGVNKKVVKGQPNPAKDGKPTLPIAKPADKKGAKKPIKPQTEEADAEDAEASDMKDMKDTKDVEKDGEKEAFDAPNAKPNHEDQVGKTKVAQPKSVPQIKAEEADAEEGEDAESKKDMKAQAKDEEVDTKAADAEGEDAESEDAESDKKAFDAPNATPNHEEQVGKKTKVPAPKQVAGKSKKALDADITPSAEVPVIETQAASISADAQATIAKMKAEYESLLERIARVEAAEKSAEVKVAKTIAALGVEPVAATIAENGDAPMSAEDIVKQWNGIKDAKESRAFYLKHEKTIRNASFGKTKGFA